MLNMLKRYFLAGIVALAPILITVLLVNWLIGLSVRFSMYMQDTYQIRELTGIQFPGMDIILALLFILLIGAITTQVIGGKLMSFLNQFMERIPIIRTTHKATRQLLGAMVGDSSQSFKQVVWIQFPQPGQWVIGFVTAEGSLPGCEEDESLVAVFIPSTPLPTTGWLLYVEPSKLRFPKLSIDEGMKLVLSGGVLAAEIGAKKAEY
ncbi:MAG: DUF502 domain-containing protein [Ghiorsea sp.]